MEAAIDDLMREVLPETSSPHWDYDQLEVVDRVADVLDDWFVGADEPLLDTDDLMPARESMLVPALFYGSVTAAALGGVVASLL